MRHVACLGMVLGSVVLSFWGCGDDGSTTGSTGADPIPCETERDCVDETNPCRRGFCFDKVCEMQDIDNGEQPGAEQIDGDCMSIACVGGVGQTIPANDPPDDDGADCMVPACAEGQATEVPREAGEQCNTGSGTGLCDDAGTCGCAPVGDSDVYVDPVNGTDDEEHGGGRGACAYRTLTYALTQGVRNIRPAVAEYSDATGETLPFVLTGQQRIRCYDDSVQMSASIVGNGTFETVTAAVVLNGQGTRIEGCIVDASGGDYGVAIASDPNNGHEVTYSDISGALTGVGVLAGGNSVFVFENSIHDNTNVGLAWLGTGQNGQVENNEFTNNGADIDCASSSPDVGGFGNTSSTCTGCQNCPF